MVVNYRKLDAPVFYMLTILSSDEEIGSAAGGGMYKQGQSVTVTATPVEGKGLFSGWRNQAGELVSSQPSYTFSIIEDMVLTAVFTKLCTVTLTADPPDTGTLSGVGAYPAGQTVTVTAKPDSGYMFAGWRDSGGQLLSTEPVYSFTLSGDMELTAFFAVECVVTVVVSPQGAGTPTGAGRYPKGAAVTVDAGPNQGYRFTGWRGDSGELLSTEQRYTFEVQGDVSLTAEYVQVFSVIIVTNIPEAGVPSGMGEYPAGSTVTVKANTEEGYNFTGWQNESGETISTLPEYSFVINSDVTLLAVYEQVLSRLPAGYKELEYIQSNGLQYIDTGVQPKTTLKFAMDFAVDSLSSKVVSFFGWRKKAGTTYVQFRGIENNTNTFRVIYGGNSTSNATAIDSSLSVGRHALELDCQNKTLVWDGKSSSFKINGTPSFSTTYNIVLFASNNEGTVGEYSSMKLYKTQIWDAGNPIRDFVPCTDPSGKAGLYDLVSQAFYTNKRVSAFIAGPEV